MELSGYEKSLTVEALVLLELRDARSVPGDELIARVKSRCSGLAENLAEFGFVGWLGTTIWGVLDSFAETRFISHSGRRPSNPHEWRIATLRIEPLGERFLENARIEAPKVFQLLGGELAPRSAVG